MVQGALMAVDEFYFHERRGLPKWERIGHPLDSFSVLATLSISALVPFSERSFKFFLGLAIFSSFFITKDQFIHSENCSKTEQWIHAVLFMLHPVIFMSTGIIWKQSPDDVLLKLQSGIVCGFMLYQVLRWSLPWKMPLK